MTTITVEIDWENNGDEFWDALAKSPRNELLKKFRLADSARVTPEEWTFLQSLPGWTGGPEYAPHPLMIAEE